MPTRRMLVIVNPYATTMSVRLKQLVVYALQGRYEVEAVDTQRKGHATELCRDAALEGYDVVVAFGGDGTVNEVANGLAGTRTALVPLPGGATNVYCRMLGIPTDVVDATEHLLRLADALGAAPGRPRPRQRPLVHVLRRRGARRHGRRARRPPPAAEGAARPLVLRAGRDRRLPREVRRQRAEGRRRGRRRGARGRLRVRPERPALHVLPPPPDHALAGRGARLGRPLRRRARPRQRARPADDRLPPALQARAQVGRHRQAHAFDGLDGLRVRSCDDRPVPVQVDGDYVGEHEEAVFSVRPGALRVLA